MPEQPRRDAPAAGDDRNPSAAADRPHDLPDGFFDRHHPEQTVALGHRRIDKARTDVGDVKRESGFRGALPQSLGVVDLIGFRGVVGRSRSPAAQSADRRDDDQMSAALPLETVVGPVCDRRPARDSDRPFRRRPRTNPCRPAPGPDVPAPQRSRRAVSRRRRQSGMQQNRPARSPSTDFPGGRPAPRHIPAPQSTPQGRGRCRKWHR